MRGFLFHPFKVASLLFKRRYYERKLQMWYLEHISTMLEGIYAKDEYAISSALRNSGNSKTVRSGREHIYIYDSILESIDSKLEELI